MDNKGENVQEVYESKTEMLGVDSADFILQDATYIRIQVLVRGKVKRLPTDLINSIAKSVREYELSKKEGI